MKEIDIVLAIKQLDYYYSESYIISEKIVNKLKKFENPINEVLIFSHCLKKMESMIYYLFSMNKIYFDYLKEEIFGIFIFLDIDLISLINDNPDLFNEYNENFRNSWNFELIDIKTKINNISEKNRILNEEKLHIEYLKTNNNEDMDLINELEKIVIEFENIIKNEKTDYFKKPDNEYSINYIRGHEYLSRWSDGIPDIYVDTKEEVDDSRPCIRCGKMPTKEGYDACLGHIEGAEFACCGHGLKEGYVKWENGENSKIPINRKNDKIL